MEDAVKSMKRTIGENHPNTIVAMDSLRDWQRNMQDTSEEGSMEKRPKRRVFWPRVKGRLLRLAREWRAP